MSGCGDNDYLMFVISSGPNVLHGTVATQTVHFPGWEAEGQEPRRGKRERLIYRQSGTDPQGDLWKTMHASKKLKFTQYPL